VPPDGAVPRGGDGDLTRWASLSREEKDLQSRRREFEDRIGSLEDRRDALDAEDARRRSDYGNYPTDPSVVAAAQFWDEEYGRRRSAIQDELADLRSGAAEIDRVLREVQLEMRDLSIGP
jgi:chromosome segregation ATPase